MVKSTCEWQFYEKMNFDQLVRGTFDIVSPSCLHVPLSTPGLTPMRLHCPDCPNGRSSRGYKTYEERMSSDVKIRATIEL